MELDLNSDGILPITSRMLLYLIEISDGFSLRNQNPAAPMKKEMQQLKTI
jgi:hypothetical protein